MNSSFLSGALLNLRMESGGKQETKFKQTHPLSDSERDSFSATVSNIYVVERSVLINLVLFSLLNQLP